MFDVIRNPQPQFESLESLREDEGFEVSDEGSGDPLEILMRREELEMQSDDAVTLS